MYLMLNLSLRQQKKSFTLPNVNYISNDSINDLGLEILKTTKEYPESC